MPRKVDHAARRAEIAGAVCRLVGAQGLDAVSLRHVAAEAGVSMGMVQHYFTTKDDMVEFAFGVIGERAATRIEAALTAAPGARARLRALLVELMCLDDRAEAAMWTAFLARAVVEPRLAAKLTEGSEGMAGLVANLVTEAGGEPDAELDARALLAVADGLMTHVLVGQTDAATALAALDRHLDRLVGVEE